MRLTVKKIEAVCRHHRAGAPVMAAMIDAVGPVTLRFDVLLEE
jgi:hypothetical protein